MKLGLNLILVTALLAAFTLDVAGQETDSAAQSAVGLHEQLADIKAREAALEERARQLDESLKPENIERSLAGVGSTKPEELRELRRRQLSIERESVRTQLKTVATSRERLESAVRNAETLAYQQSAEGTSLPGTQMLAAQYATIPRWLVLMVGLVGIGGLGLVVLMIRKRFAIR